MNGAVKVIQELAVIFKYGSLIVVLCKLIIDVKKLNRL